MQLLRFEHNGETRLGARKGNSVVDLNRADASIPSDIVGFIEAGSGALQAAQRAVESGAATVSADLIRVLAPVSNPQKVICIGLNYADHAAESNMPIPPEPVVFSKFASCIIGPGDAIEAPRSSSKLDYEVELVVVIGKSGKNIPEAKALDHVFGYTVGHDVSARDFQLEKPAGQWLLGKTFDTFAPLGPHIVTTDEIPNPHDLGIRCIVNGETVQNSKTDQLIFKIEHLIYYLSQVFTLSPGDLLFTGTPPGVGMGRTPQLWLKPGDTVACEVDSIGRIENPVV
ncbi:MAG: fumarylacetoacetate hydrolase family protein [bacterium]|nr:fumarylacetoacetate hydrolase family protein [bacterium]